MSPENSKCETGYIHVTPAKKNIFLFGFILGSAAILWYFYTLIMPLLMIALVLWAIAGSAALLMLPTQYDDIMPNDSISDMKDTLRELVDVARHRIDFMGYSCDDLVFSGEPDLVQALERAIERKVVMRFIYEKYNVSDENARRILQSPGVELFQKENIAKPHFVIIDGKHVRAEKYHTDNDRESPKATNIFHSLFVAQSKNKIFNEELKTANKIQLPPKES